MKRKAVIVGISDYGSGVVELPSAETEAEEWKKTLSGCGFLAGDIRMVCGKRATKLAVMERLAWLLTDVEDGDQLFFSFHGHGVRLMRRNLNGMVHDERDEAIVAYPEAGNDVEQHSLYDDDLARLVLLSRLPPYADFTVVLDCCYGGAFSVTEPDQPKVFIPPRDIRHRDQDTHRRKTTFRFGQCRRLPSHSQNPVTIAAADELETSQLSAQLENRWRSVFGYFTLKSLQTNREQSYKELVDSVKPSMRDRNIPNAPVLGGNQARFNHLFLQ